jgi:proteasome alpha subunit
MESITQMNYDKAMVTFSPEGRLYQVEYAREAVKRGTTSIGIKARDGVVLIVDKRDDNKLLEIESIKRIHQIDDHIVVTGSGLVADMKVLINILLHKSQENRITYDDDIDIETLTNHVCQVIQYYTQTGGFRPFGVSLLIAGMDDDKPRLFQTDPSGAMLEYKATAIGFNSSKIIDIFKKEYKEMNIEDTIKFGVDTLKTITNVDNIEISVIDQKGYRKCSTIPSVKNVNGKKSVTKLVKK